MSNIPTITRSKNCPSCGTEYFLDRMGHSAKPACQICRFPLMLIANKYRLMRQIGAGGYGRIYEAEHVHLDQEAKRVIKIIKPEALLDPSTQKRFYREIQVTSTLSQKNHHIVRVFDDFGYIEYLGHFYIMEYLEGIPFTRLLKPPSPILPLNLAYHIFLQLCDAMQAAHKQSIVHRDLKPANLMIIEHGRDPYFLKVIDFGISKIGETSEFTMNTLSPIGTPKYMAPEQISMDQVDARTDIYSMGILLYEMLVGRTPFVPRINKGKDRVPPLSMMKAHCDKPPPPLKDFCPEGRILPENLEKVLFKALEKNPNDRYNNVIEFEQAFREVTQFESMRSDSFELKSQPKETAGANSFWEQAPSHSPPIPSQGLPFQTDTPLPTGEREISSVQFPPKQAVLEQAILEPAYPFSSFKKPDMVSNDSLAFVPPIKSQHELKATIVDQEAFSLSDLEAYAKGKPKKKWSSREITLFALLLVAVVAGIFFAWYLSQNPTEKKQSISAGISKSSKTNEGSSGTSLKTITPKEIPSKRTLEVTTKQNASSHRIVYGCPKKKLFWINIQLPDVQQRGLAPRLEGARIIKTKKGFCVGTKAQKSALLLGGDDTGFLLCILPIRRLKGKVRVLLTPEGELEPTSTDYCLLR